MIKYKTKKCIICGREYLVNNGTASRVNKNIRNRNSLTCSRQCSLIYSRVTIHSYTTIYRLEKKVEDLKTIINELKGGQMKNG
jgi:hypothetical protein